MMSRQSVLICAAFCVLMLSLFACKLEGEKPTIPKSEAPAVASQPLPVQQPQPQPQPPSLAPEKAVPGNLVVEVNGHRMTQEQLDAEMNRRLLSMKDQIPPDRLQEAKDSIKKRLVEDYVIRMLLVDEINHKKITATDRDVREAVDQLRGTLPQGVTIEDLIEKNRMTNEEMYEEIRLGVQINKLVQNAVGGKIEPTEKEITAFYQKNKDKFKLPESVHARHILIAKTAAEDENVRAGKKARAEELRKKLMEGADFVQTALAYSDCPSKQTGGDLGTFTRGQMVKPFEDAAFSQKKGEIGPIVETDFGYHIIQVLEKSSSKIMTLDAEAKERITQFLTQQKQQEAFDRLIKGLREKAKVVYYGQ